MSKIFITGSSDGLGLLAGKLLLGQGHEVVLHARNDARAATTRQETNATVLTADLGSIEAIKMLADEVNGMGPFDAVIHNAGVYKVPSDAVSQDGLPLVFAVNTLAAYLLTCLIDKPKRLVYMSSDMHLGGDPQLRDLKEGSFHSTYSDTKLHDLILAFAVARKWPEVYSNAVHPGWVPTKMGGAGAPDDLQKGYETQAWLAASDETAAMVSGRYFFHQKQADHLRIAEDVAMQENLLKICGDLSGVVFPKY